MNSTIKQDKEEIVQWISTPSNRKSEDGSTVNYRTTFSQTLLLSSASK